MTSWTWGSTANHGFEQQSRERPQGISAQEAVVFGPISSCVSVQVLFSCVEPGEPLPPQPDAVCTPGPGPLPSKEVLRKVEVVGVFSTFENMSGWQQCVKKILAESLERKQLKDSRSMVLKEEEFH